MVAVLELIRKEDGLPFHEEDEEIACSYLVWGGIALHVCIYFVNFVTVVRITAKVLMLIWPLYSSVSLSVPLETFKQVDQNCKREGKTHLYIKGSTAMVCGISYEGWREFKYWLTFLSTNIFLNFPI